MVVLHFIYLFKIFIYLFWLHRVLVVARGIFFFFFFSFSRWDLVPQPGIEPGSPALGAWSLTHWTTRKVPRVFSFNGVEWKRKCQHVLYIILLRIVS